MKISNFFLFLTILGIFYFVLPLIHELGHCIVIFIQNLDFELYYDFILPFLSHVTFSYFSSKEKEVDFVSIYSAGFLFNFLIAFLIFSITIILFYFNKITKKTFSFLVIISIILTFDIPFQLIIQFFGNTDMTFIPIMLQFQMAFSLLIFYFCIYLVFYYEKKRLEK